LLLLDLKDLQAMLQYVGDHANEFQTQYGKRRGPGICLRSASRAGQSISARYNDWTWPGAGISDLV
jgi:hypothetical protein